jgi:hypothetical protein
MPATQQMFGRPHHRVRDSVDIRQKRLRDQTYSHKVTMIAADVLHTALPVDNPQTLRNV